MAAQNIVVHQRKLFTLSILIGKYLYKMLSCFLCNKPKSSNDIFYEKIEYHKMPSSQKCLSAVLQHLANILETKLIFKPSACICFSCFEELKIYDDLMVRLLGKQKKLTRQLKESLKILTQQQQQMNKSEKGNIHENTSEKDRDHDETLIIDNSLQDRKRVKQECLLCGIEFRSKHQLVNHNAEIHNSQELFSCKICGIVRRDAEYLELHMNIHEGKTENECRYCPKSFSRPVNTLRHMRLHWDKKKFQCEKCGERFSLDNMLYNHRMRHEAEENPIVCEICQQSFKSKKTFNHHVLIHQENRPRYHCIECPKSFTERYTLKVHLKNYHKIEDDQKDDNGSTSKSTENEANLNVVYVEAEDQPVVVETVETSECCVICHMSFDNKEILENHLEAEHDVILNS